MRNIPHISNQNQEFYALESRLSAGDLSLSEIRDIEDTVLFRMKDKTQEAAFSLFEKIATRRSQLLEKEVEVLKKDSDISSKVQQFILSQSTFSPEEMEEKLLEIEMDVALMSEETEVTEAVRRQLAHLHFALEYPVARELESNSIESNFISRVGQIRERILKEQSIASFNELSTVQKREILMLAKGDLS